MRKIAAVTFCLLVFLGTSDRLYGAARTASVSGNWSSTATWGGNAVPTSGDNVTINSGITVTVDIPGATCASLTFAANGTNSMVTISGTNSLEVTGAVSYSNPNTDNRNQTVDVGAGSLSCASVAMVNTSNTRVNILTVSTGTIDVSGNVACPGNNAADNLIVFSGDGILFIGGNFTIAAVTFTASTGTVTYDGTGAQTVGGVTYNNLTLSGSGAKTTTGATVNGILSMEGTATTAGTAANYGTDATLQYKGTAAQTTGTEFPPTFNGTGGVIINNASGVALATAKTITYLLNMTVGTLNMANTNLSVGSLTGPGNLTHSSGTAGARTLTIGSDNTSPAEYTGVISDGTATSVLVTKTGSGMLTLSGLNSYSGATTVSAGTLSINSMADGGISSALGTGSTTPAISIGATGVLQYMGTGHSSNRAINLTADGGSVDASGSGTLTLSGGVAGNNYDLVLTGTGAGIESGVIATNNGTLTKNESGTWTLSGLNTYTGATAINDGTLSINTLQNVSGGSSSLGAPTTAGNGTIGIGATGILQYLGTGHTSNRIVNLTADGGTIDASGSGDLTLSGGVTGNTFDLVLSGTGTGIESGAIATTSGTVTKTGTGTWTLSASNTYTGVTTVSAGTLRLGANGGGTNTPLGTTGSGTSVLSGATLDLNGYTLGTAEALILNGMGVLGNGALTNSSATAANYNGAITLGSASSIGTTGNITLGVNGITGGFDLNKVGSGMLHLGSGATTVNNLSITEGSLTSTSYTLFIAGNLTNNGTFTHNSGTVSFNGSGAQSVAGVAYNNLILLNGGTKTLQGNTSLSAAGVLTLTSGVLELGNYNLTVNNNAAAAITGTFSGTSMIATDGTGSLIKLGTAAAHYQTTYPLGAGTYYNPLVISTLTAGGYAGNITVRAVAGRNPNLPFAYDGLLKYWIVSTTGITGITNAQLTLQYNSGEVTGSSANYVPRIWNGIAFVAPGNPTAAGVNPFGTTGAGTNTLLAGEWTALDPTAKTTFYSYKNGNWNDFNTWTFDPSGSLYNNPSNDFPGAGDKAVIFSGRTITMTNNGTSVSSVTVEGILDLAATSGHTFSNIAGGGKIRISTADIFPSYSTNTLFTTDEGTVEYYGSGFTLSTPRTLYNLEVSMTTGQTLTFMASPYTVSGDLTVKSGIFQINDNTATSPQYITVFKDITINSAASFTVGSGNTLNGPIDENGTGSLQYYLAYHTVYCYGDFTNNGSVAFTNQTAPVYNNFSTNGAVSLFFNGSSDNTFTCNGTTNLYNLVLDKGSDKSYTLTVYSTQEANFRLYGRINEGLGSTGGSFTTENPELRKALWIRNGTLELTGSLYIPSLTEGGDYYIPSNGALWINGANVSVYTTERTDPGANVGGVQGTGADVSNGGAQSFSIYGDLKVSNGYLTTASHGIVLWYQATTFGQILVEGGQCDLPGIRTANGNTAGKFSFIQTGGLIRFLGSYGREILENYASLCIRGTDCAYNVTGGSMEFYDGQTGANNGGTATGGIIRIETDPTNISVTGGTTTIIRNDANFDNQTIYTTAPFYNLTLTGASASPLTANINTAITIVNDLAINDNSTLISNSNNVTIGGDFTLGNTTTSNATYTAGTNTTTFNGNRNSVIVVANTAVPAATGTVAPLNFYNFTIDKTLVTPLSNAWSVTLSSPGRTEVSSNQDNRLCDIRGNLLINRGKYNYYRYKTRLYGNYSNYGASLGDVTNTGRITLENGSAPHQLTGSTSSVISFGDIELNDAQGALLNTNISTGNYYLTTGIFSIGTYNLAISGSINGAGYSTSKMIQCYGSPASQGVTFTLSLSGNYAAQNVAVIPVGVGGAVSGTAKYTPLTIRINGNVGTGPYTGTINVRPVDEYHPTSDPVKLPDLIPYYWATLVTGNLSSVTSSMVRYTFTATPDFDYSGGKKDTYYRNNAWEEESGQDLIFDQTGFFDTDYSVGKKNSYKTVQYLYSRQSGNWNSLATWSLTGHGVTNAPTVLNDFDVRQIGGSDGQNHQITVPASVTAIASQLIILGKSETGIATGYPPSLIIAAGTSGHDFYFINGNGRFVLNDGTFPGGDFNDFCLSDEAIFEYSGGTYAIPSNLTVYPTLWITGTSGSVKTLPAADLLIRKNLNIYDPANTGIALNLNTGANGNLTINDSLVLSNASRLVFPNGANNRTVTVLKNIDCASVDATDVNSIEVAAGGTFSTPTHQLNVQGNIRVGASALTLWNSNSQKSVDLQFYGDANSTVYSSGSSGNIDLSKLTINKSLSTLATYFDEEFSLNAPTNAATKPLILTKGILEIDNAATSIVLSSGGGNFTIPSTASLVLNDGTLGLSGNNTGIDLEGKLEINGGTMNVYDASSTNNYIQYYSTGFSELHITGGTLHVGSQIRRLTTTSGGILAYNQSGGTVVVGYKDVTTTNRGVLEVLNSGSRFAFTGGSLTIYRGNATASVPSLYISLDAADATIASGTTINIGGASGSPQIGIYSSAPVHHIAISGTGTPVAKMWNIPLVVNGNLTINSGAAFDANGLLLTIKGDFTNSGSFTHNLNTTLFDGTGTQVITGATTFYNLTKQATGILQLASNIQVSHGLAIEAGTLMDQGNNIRVLGDVTNSAVHTYEGSAGSSTQLGIHMNGTLQQSISGSGTFGKVTVDNASSVVLPVGNSILITDALRLNTGVFDIQGNLLALGVNCSIEGSGFSATKMIQTNISFTDNGVKKTFPAGASTFFLPIGSIGKYTPVAYTVTGNDNSTGTITTKAANEIHPSITDDTETACQLVDQDNVLQYHWILKSSGISGFSGTCVMYGNVADIEVNNSCGLDATDYITARLLANSITWNKYDDTKFDEGTAALTFDFVGNDDGGIEGEYTAGLDDAIPNTVAMFETVASGNWTNTAIWQTVPTGGSVPAGGPRGAIIRINAPHTVDVNNDGEVYIYRSQILGTLDLNTTYQHRLGNVTGNGTIRMVDMNNLPAGDYTGTSGFITATGGTLEYAGTTNYSVLSDIPLLNSVVFSGSGKREMPNLDLSVYGNITIAGPDVVNTFDKTITLRGNLSMTSGTYYAGIGTSEINFTGTAAQSVTGNFTAANSSDMYNLRINKSASDVTLGSAIEISKHLTLTDGNIITTSINILTITNPLGTAVSGGSSNSYVNGPLQKRIDDAGGFLFPVGKGSRYGYFSVTNTNTTGTQVWKAEYNTSFSDYLNPLAPLVAVSSNEHWQITGPAGGTCLVTGRWDNQSDINPLTASGASNMRTAEYNGADWANIGNGGTTGDNNNGTIISSSTVTPGASGKYYTLGSIAALLPRIRFAGMAQVCSGVANNISVDFSNGSPNYDFRYSIDGAGSFQATGLPTGSDPFSFTATTSGRYRIIAGSFTANGVTGVVDTASVYIIALPVQPTISPANGDPSLTFCTGGNVILTSSAENSYLWSTGATTQAITVDTSGGFTVQVTNASGCTSMVSAVKTVRVNPLPIITLTGTAIVCKGETAVYTTESGMTNYSWTISAGGSVSAGGAGNDNTVTVVWNLVTFPPIPSLQTVTVNYDDSNSCSALSNEVLNVNVFKIPETGPEYHIKNAWNP